MHIAIFDFETSGLPLYNDPSEDPRRFSAMAERIAPIDSPVKVPDGWKLVPVELTKNMEHMAKYVGGIHNVKKAWDAMLAAAPEYKP